MTAGGDIAGAFGPASRAAAPPGWPWLAVAGVLAVTGAALWTVDPRLGVAVLALAGAPVLVIAPAWAFLAVVALLPFDAIASLVESRALSLTRLLGMAVLAGWVTHVLLLRRPVRLGAPGLLLGAWVAFAGVSVGWAPNTETAVGQLRTLIQLFAFYVMAVQVTTRPADARRTLDVLLAATVGIAAVALWQLPGAGHSGRAHVVFGDQDFNPNYLAATLVFPAIAAIAIGRGGEPLGWWRIGAVVPIVVTLIATGSRGGTVALAVGLATLAALRPRFGMRAAAAVLCAGLALPFVMTDTARDHLEARWAGTTEDRLSGRLDIWTVGAAMVADHPVQGTGLAGFREEFYRYMIDARVDPHFALLHSRGNRVSHNVYLGTLAELGCVGGGLLLAALLAHGRAAWSVARQRRAILPAVALPPLFASMMVFGGSIDLMTQKLPWLLLALMQASVLPDAEPGA